MTKAKIVLVSFIWLILLAVGISLWKLVILPSRESESQKKATAESERKVQVTQGTSKYSAEIALGIDSFSGYAIFRCDEFQQQLSQKGIRCRQVDDQADYVARAKALADGKIQMALFPADALIKTSSNLSSLPATIIAIVDETRGADAMVAYKSRFPNIDSLNSDQTRFVLVGDSPSETLARVVMHDFDLSKLHPKAFESVTTPEKIIERYRLATPSSNEVFITWQPYVSQLLSNDQLHVVIDSSRFTGYIVDCLVVSRDYLIKNQANVDAFLECYFKTLYGYRDKTLLTQLVLADAKKTGLAITPVQATQLVEGIQWKNTQENFAHFGLRSGSLIHVEDMLSRITSVLMATKAIQTDPTDGQPTRLFFDRPLAGLMSRNFHPGLANEEVKEQTALVVLSEQQWSELVDVGTLSVPELVFARGSSTLTEQSRVILDELAEKLRSWPQYYLKIHGTASLKGDAVANQALADRRAEVAKEYLIQHGISPDRVRAIEGKPTGETRVLFQVCQLPF